MKKTLFIALIFAKISMVFSQKTPLSGEFEYVVEDSLSNVEHNRYEFDIANLSYQGQHISLNLGLGVRLYHIFPNFSIEALFQQRIRQEGFANYFYYFEPGSYDAYGLVKPRRGKEYKFSVAYTFFQTQTQVNEKITLKTEGSTVYVSEIPINEITTKDITIGYVHFDMPSNIISRQNRGVYMLQKTRNISIGYSKKKFHHQVMRTNKFGTVTASHFSDFYLNLLIQIQNPFPQKIARFPNASEFMNNSFLLNSEQLDQLKNNLYYLPIGLVVGYDFAHMKKGWGMKFNFGVRPGYTSANARRIVDPLTANIVCSYHIVSGKKESTQINTYEKQKYPSNK